MSLQVIEIRNTRAGEVAYILDTKRGVVMRVYVEDFTQGEDSFEEERETAPAPRRRIPAKVRVPGGGESLSEEDVDALPDPMAFRARRHTVTERGAEEGADQQEDKPKPIMGRPRPPVPPELRGVFLKPGMRGADQESRNI